MVSRNTQLQITVGCLNLWSFPQGVPSAPKRIPLIAQDIVDTGIEVIGIQEADMWMMGHLVQELKTLKKDPFVYFAPSDERHDASYAVPVYELGPLMSFSHKTRLGTALLSFEPLTEVYASAYSNFWPKAAEMRERVEANQADWLGRNGKLVPWFGTEYSTDAQETLYSVLISGMHGKFRVGSTHLTWYINNGRPAPEQQEASKQLLRHLARHEVDILAADSNCHSMDPGSTFDVLTDHGYRLVFPPNYLSLDPTYFRNPAIAEELSVDNIAYNPKFAQRDWQVRTGRSDHKFLSATLRRI